MPGFGFGSAMAQGVTGPGLVIIRGSVLATGAILRGTGFTVAKPSAGHYTITFIRPFAAPPVFVAAGWTDDITYTTGGPYTVTVSRTVVTVITREAANNVTGDKPFDFIAISV
jgi:hypothetical protein